MKCSRNQYGWLKYRVNVEMEERYPELFESYWKRKYKVICNYCFDSSRWWIMPLLLSILFSISFIPIGIFDILDITYDTAKTLVDQRIANTAAIISMTLAVIGFLISNLAIKESFAYGLLFKRSKMYPIIYFTLGTIGWLIIISTLRDSFKENIYFQKLVVTGTYMVLVVLFLIGLLFRWIMRFTNSKHIWRLLREELLKEAYLHVRKSLITKSSKEMYDQLLKLHNGNKYTMEFALASLNFNQDNTDELEIKENDNVQIVIDDVNMHGISMFLNSKQNKGKIYYNELTLGKKTSSFDDYIWEEDSPNTLDEKKKLKKLIVSKKIPLEEIADDAEDENAVRKHFDQKLEELADTSKYRDVEILLDAYLDLYRLQLKYKV